MMLGLGANLMLKNGGGAASAFDPTTVSGMAAWWAARKESFANNDPVGTATDWTGNGLSLTQTTASAKPTFVTNAKNGQPAFDLDGVDDYLDGSNILNIGTGSIHFFAVAAFDSAAGNQVLFSKADYFDSTVPRYGASGITSGTWWNILTDTTPTTHQLTPGTADTSWHLFEYVLNRDTGVFSVILDGTQIASQAGIPAGNLTSTDVFVLGAWGEAQGFFANAKVAEIWCWQRVLTAGERTTLRDGANSLYSIY
jgi:hypothetical protein